MAISPSRALIKYIEDGIEKSAYSWVYPEVYEKSLLALIISIKRLPRITLGRLKNTDNILTNMKVFYSYICIDVIRRLSHYNKIHSLNEYDDSKNSIIDVCLNQSYDALLKRVLIELGSEQNNTYKTAIKIISKDAHFLCWHFFVIAKSLNLIEKLIEEHYLLLEINLFKKLKE